ncbi:Subunit of the heme-activated glucose-repressed Hap2-3-4-5 CCAAT-binding complex [Blumeria graminis f. sp. tritici 96224]|uniref:Bgt-2043 n=1 Tax=Blumeria graminis f. sp. tritici 96224 TaxID=1268274 RepID=A0A061HM56_BLUGR|nr:Subunit of the heme-activated glucose-repressed Hap2-3-4-5 CCAAT-binding complex [Blumeria graminis f. sp. tritici 96224]
MKMESSKTQNVRDQNQEAPPAYDINHGGHYGASAALSVQGYAPVAEFYTGTWANVNQGLHGNYKDILTTYWQHTINHLETESHDYKLHQLPLARIKKVMKADPDVKMISAEAPILFAKGCDIFITELTMRAWIHAEENKRRTLQRSDIASALNKSDMFDFLIDIVPRDEATGERQKRGISGPATAVPNTLTPHASHPGATSQTFSGQLSSSGQEEYTSREAVFAGPAQPGSGPSAYGGSSGQVFAEIDGIYGYSPMPTHQQIFQLPSQRQLSRHIPNLNHDPAITSDASTAGKNYSSQDDNDADGERDFESQDVMAQP